MELQISHSVCTKVSEEGTEEGVRIINRIVFLVFLPLLLFCKMYDSDFSIVFSRKLLLFIIAMELLHFGCYVFIARLFESSPSRRSIMTVSMLKANTALFSIHIVSSLLGADTDFGLICILLGVTTPVRNMLCMMILKPDRKSTGQILPFLWSIFKTPLIVGIFAGLFFNLLHIPLPKLLVTPLSTLGSIATPIAFVALGATLQFRQAAENRYAILGVTLGRLFVSPILWLAGAYAMGWRSASLVAFLALAVPSTGVSTLPLVQETGGDTKLSADLILFTALISILSIFVWITICKAVHLF